MDETISLMIKNGFKLAKELESNLPYLVDQPNILSKWCDEVARIFSGASDELNARVATLYAGGSGTGPDGGVQEWLMRYGGTQAMDLIHAQLAAEKKPLDIVPETSMDEGTQWWRPGRLEVVPVNDAARLRGTSRLEFQPTNVSASGEAGSSSQRTRRRRDGAERRTEIVPAPQIGNTEIPPEDGYTWRKYGQKEILGSRFPRSYYRCTHQKMYQCQAKKQVQRLDNDPLMFEVTYRGNHTCHMSSTAPSIPPPSTATIIQDQMTPQTTTTAQPPPPTTSNPLGTWLSMDIKPTGEGTSFITDSHLQMFGDQLGLGGTVTSSSSSMVSSGGAGPSTVRFGRDVDYQPVVDFADAMFNSGSSSNSMDVIFSSMDDK